MIVFATDGNRWLRSWLVGLLLLGACLIGIAQPANAGTTVRDVTLLPHDDGVRIVVDLGNKISFQHRTFGQPPRLVIDLPDVSWQLPERRGERSYRMIRGFRFGRLQDGVSRLVIDVDRPFEIESVFELPPSDSSGYRIITDLRPLPVGARMREQHLRRRLDVAASSGPHRPKLRPEVSEQRAERQLARVERRPPQPRRLNGRQQVHIPLARPEASVAKRMIVIDPGHGGIDPGASGKRGTYEKNVVLATALELRRQLIDTGRYDVILTRDDDSFVRLRDRLQIARASAGNLFLSLHADSLANAAEVRGGAVYTLSNKASSEEAERLANTENRADILGGIDLSHHEPIVTQILIDLAQRDANSKSLRIADLMVDELAGVTKMLREQRQQAGFVVLKSPDMPSALVELGYLSNEKDEQRLTDADHLADLARAMIKAIDRYFGVDPS